MRSTRNRRPTGLAPGTNVRANVSLTTATNGDAVVSVSRISRPREQAHAERVEVAARDAVEGGLPGLLAAHAVHPDAAGGVVVD